MPETPTSLVPRSQVLSVHPRPVRPLLGAWLPPVSASLVSLQSLHVVAVLHVVERGSFLKAGLGLCVASRHVDCSWTRDRIHVPLVGRQILIYWTTREVLRDHNNLTTSPICSLPPAVCLLIYICCHWLMV